MTESPEITLWREVLKSELLASEGRQRAFFDEQLAGKASATHVERIAERATALDRGEFTDAQVLRIEHITSEQLGAKVKESWLLRSNKATVIYILVGLAALVVAVLALLNPTVLH